MGWISIFEDKNSLPSGFHANTRRILGERTGQSPVNHIGSELPEFHGRPCQISTGGSIKVQYLLFSISYFFTKEVTSNTYLSQIQANTVVKSPFQNIFCIDGCKLHPLHYVSAFNLCIYSALKSLYENYQYYYQYYYQSNDHPKGNDQVEVIKTKSIISIRAYSIIHIRRPKIDSNWFSFSSINR